MRRILRLTPKEHFDDGGYLTRECSLKKIIDGKIVNRKKLWFKLHQEFTFIDFKDCDAYLIAVLLEAMYESCDIEVEGNVSEELLSNLEEYQAVWKFWIPSLHKVNIAVKGNISCNKPSESSKNAVLAYSGGVDALYSLWANLKRLNGFRAQHVSHAAVVHGFDIKLDKEEAYRKVFSKASSDLDEIGVKAVEIKTNYREISNVPWNYGFGSALIAALYQLKGVANTCIISSGVLYNDAGKPWGSTPLIDPLLSGNGYRVLHEGAGLSRTEKVKVISEWKQGCKNLRVCWESKIKDRNCGSCEKCQRTKLNFLVNGLQVPECFPDDSLDFSSLRLRNEVVRDEWISLYKAAIRMGIKEPWVGDLRKFVYRRPLIDHLFPKGSKLRAKVKKLAVLVPGIK